MKKAILEFWEYICKNYNEEEMYEHLENHGIKKEHLNKKYISRLKMEDAEEMMFQLFWAFQDLTGKDRYIELYDILEEATSLKGDKIDKAMGF